MTDNILLYMIIYIYILYNYIYTHIMDSCKDWPKNRSPLGAVHQTLCSVHFSNPVAIQRCVCYFMFMFNVFCWDASSSSSFIDNLSISIHYTYYSTQCSHLHRLSPPVLLGITFLKGHRETAANCVPCLTHQVFHATNLHPQITHKDG
jgi:hypothetical protein